MINNIKKSLTTLGVLSSILEFAEVLKYLEEAEPVQLVDFQSNLSTDSAVFKAYNFSQFFKVRKIFLTNLTIYNSPTFEESV